MQAYPTITPKNQMKTISYLLRISAGRKSGKNAAMITFIEKIVRSYRFEAPPNK
jgi:hypothetical protein